MMPIEATVARIRSVDFFAALLPGVYVCAAVAFVALAANAQDVAGLWLVIRQYAVAEPGWLPTVLTVLAAYLIGSIVRALPVGLVDDRIGRLVRRAWRWWPGKVGAWSHRMYDSNFPYRPFLEHHLRNLGSPLEMAASMTVLSRSFLGDDSDSTAALHARWEYWKAHLYLVEPNAAPLVHELEARTRMFCGMFWGGMVALAIAGLGAALSRSLLPLLSWTVSLPIACLFGWRLRHVRCEEARRIFLAFVISRMREQSYVSQSKPGQESNRIGSTAEENGG